MMDEFRLFMQHLKLYEMEANLKLCKVFMLMISLLMGNFGLQCTTVNLKMLVIKYH